jgi:hypothetical protein
MKKNLFLAGILAALILFSWLWSGPIKNWKTTGNIEKNFLSGLNFSSIDEIEIENSKETVVLKKEGDRWKIGGTKDFYAPSSNMDEVVSVLEKVAEGKLELVSDNKDKKDFFGFDNSSRVKIVQEGENYEFFVGKSTDDYAQSYISLDNFEKIYRVNANLAAVFSLKDWRDKQIFSFSKEHVGKIRFQYGKNQFIVEEKEDIWSGVSPWNFSVNKDKINEILDVLDDLRASDIPEQNFSGTGLEKNNLIIQIFGEDIDKTIMVGDCTEDNLCYAKRADSDNIYLITKDQKTALTKNISDLK